MNLIDIVLGIILIFAFYKGLTKGLFATLASLVGLIAGVFGAIHFSHFAANYLVAKTDWAEATINLAAFAITFLIILLVVSLVGKALTKIADFAALGLINKLLGGVFSALKMAFIISVIFMFVNASKNFSGLIISEEKKENSILYEPVAMLAPLLLPNILEQVDTFRSSDKDEGTVEDEEETPVENDTIIEE
ncbi:CvpA family protein [Patiriisocius marinus]|uniref:CvpA family protein n=1 Tax=Patiriisocius marinus TaxID=1397112 RepID=UPI00233136FF|nr:CvpA family protein [Patiriisocius marinus]